MFKKLVTFITLALPVLISPALAQMPHTPGMKPGQMQEEQTSPGGTMGGAMGAMPGTEKPAGTMGAGMAEMMAGMMKMMQSLQGRGPGIGLSVGVGGSPLSEPGQSAFATIAEVVRILIADPDTDWSVVDINALRQHLQDMDAVTLDSAVVTDAVDGGLRFNVTGDTRVAASITRMLIGHAAVMDGVNGWGYAAESIEGGVALSVSVPPEDMAQLKGLGLYGLLASGGHHQPHHWLMATGKISG